MADDSTIRIPQAYETPATVLAFPGYWCRYAYARSTDSQVAGDLGQDRMVFHTTEHKLVFALCDGVSQSFMGDLAARLLADALVEWLETAVGEDTEQLSTSLSMRLTTLVEESQHQVANFELPDDLPVLVKDVLEQKRALGSESTFIAGALDFNQRRLILVWMGDSRIRLWNREDERSTELGAEFHTAERWSSRRGIVGVPRIAILPLSGITRLLCYTDGLVILDHQKAVFSNDELDALITAAGQSPSSDDISIFEVILDQKSHVQNSLSRIVSIENPPVTVVGEPPIAPKVDRWRMAKLVAGWVNRRRFWFRLLGIIVILFLVFILLRSSLL